MKSILSYLGGKSLLARQIIELMPEHHCFCEVFAGAAWVTFKKEPSSVEIINDINGDLVNLYRVVKYHLEEFVKWFRWALMARDEYERLKHEEPSTLTDIQRAARFYYLIRLGYGGKIDNFSFTTTPSRRPRLNLLRIEEELSEAHLRLARVWVENLPYNVLIERHDRPDTLFYIDPPYWAHENDYGKGIFCRQDFTKLRDLLSTIKGKFIMSINDVPEIRDMYKGFNIREAQTSYSAGGTNKKVTELIITNFK